MRGVAPGATPLFFSPFSLPRIPGTIEGRCPRAGCVMRYLIDGYNLLHAMGLLHGKAGPHGLEKARLALLGHLCGCHRENVSAVTVVFDASGAPPGAVPEDEYQG